MLRAVVFDFDGVIADDERLHLEGFRRALSAEGIGVSEREYFERYIGFDDRDGFAAILRDNGREADYAVIARLMVAKAREFSALARAHATIYPGVRPLLEQLRCGPDRLPLAIASGALRSEIELLLRLGGLGHFFDEIVSAEDVSASKPDPESYRKAVALLARRVPGLQAHQCVAIEDTSTGLRSARAAGLRTVAVAHTCPAATLSADLVVHGLGELTRTRIERLVYTK